MLRQLFLADAGEGRLVYVSDWQDVSGVGCFNYEGIDCELRLAQPQEETKKILELSGASEDCSSVTLHWRKLPQAAADILAYSISVDGQEAAVVPAVSRDGSETRSWTVRGLRESRTYTFRLGVIDGQCRLYPASSDVPVTVQEDKERPVALYAYMRGEDLVEILFSKALDPASADTPAAYRIEGGTVLSAAVRPEAPERVLLRVSMAPGCGTPNGKHLEIRGVTDDTKHRNRMEDTQCEVFGRLTEADFSMCGGIRRCVRRSASATARGSVSRCAATRKIKRIVCSWQNAPSRPESILSCICARTESFACIPCGATSVWG